MTDMKRITISLTDDLADALEQLKKAEEFRNVSYSELIRIMIQRGLAKASANN